jgi:predicted ArsR family transcriptional regulator
MIHRLAYLLRIRNVQQGLITRSRIIDLLDVQRWKTATEIANELPVTAQTVTYHLRNLENEDVVVRNPKRGWRFAPIHQTELTEFLKKRRRKKKPGSQS